MTRYALAIAMVSVLAAALGAPATAQSLCDRPLSALTAAQLASCRGASIVVIRPRVEEHPAAGVTLRGQ